MSNQHTFARCSLVLMVLFCCSITLVASEDSLSATTSAPIRISVADVVSRLQDRQNAFQSARFVWNRRIQMPKEHVATIVTEWSNKSSDFNADFQRDLLLIKGKKIRYQTGITNLGTGDVGSLTTSFDGEVAYNHQPKALEGKGRGVIGSATTSDDINNAHLSALLLSVLPLDENLLPITPSSWEIGGQREIDGQMCIELLPKSEYRNPVYRKVCLDLQRDYVPLHFEEMRSDGTTVATADIAYTQQLGMWIPSVWRVNCYFRAHGSLTESSENTLIEFSMNDQMSDDDFRVKYPKGTIVYDKRQKGNQEFVAQGDGTLLPRGDDVIIRGVSKSQPWRHFVLVINTFVVILCAGWYFIRKRLRST